LDGKEVSAVKSRRWIFVVMSAVAVAIIIFVGRSLDWHAAWQRVQSLGTWQIIVILLFPLTYHAITALRLRLILDYLGHQLRTRTILGYSIASFAASYLIPSLDLSGKSVKFVFFRSQGVKSPTAVVALSVEAIVGSGTDLIAKFVLFFLLGLAAFLNETLFKIAFAAYSLMLIAFFLPLLKTGFIRHLTARHSIIEFHENLREEYMHLLKNPRQLFILFAVSLIGFALGFLELKIISEFLGILMTGRALFLTYALMHTTWILPTSGGIGTLEGALIGVFYALGQNPVMALALLLTYRLKEFAWVITGLALLATNGINIFKNGNHNR